ncbi:MAG: LEA type 2 family protein [Phycisphaerales bacterium]|nr:LEA type 2 family protein [Phycisphaerales bacterium]
MTKSLIHRAARPASGALVLLLAGAIVPIGGCSGTASPRAVVTDASIRERSAEAAVVEFVLEAANPNDVELPIRDITYTLSLDGREVFSGRREAMVTMPREETQRVTIPAVVPMGEGGVEAAMHRYSLRGVMHYSLPTQLADVLFDAKLSRPSVAFGDEGEIDLR